MSTLRCLLPLLPALLSPLLLPSCTVALGKSARPLPSTPKGAAPEQVHSVYGPPVSSEALTPPVPLSSIRELRKLGYARNDKRKVALREEFVLHGWYHEADDPDGVGGLATMSASTLFLAEPLLGTVAVGKRIHAFMSPRKVVVWYTPERREAYTLKD